MKPEHAVAFVTTMEGRRVGLAFLYARGHLVTCAHVVNSALRRQRRTAARPGTVRVRLVFAFGGSCEAELAAWGPGREWRSRDDWAVLRAEAPRRLTPLRIALSPATGPIQLCGPSEEHDGRGLNHVAGKLMGDSAPGLRQIHQNDDSPFLARPGYSGGPVWTPETGEVLGVLRTADENTETNADCLDLTELRPRLLRAARPPETVDLLHLHGLRMDDEPERVASLLKEITDAAYAHTVWPDAVLFSGNLSASALPAQFARVRALITGLEGAFGLPGGRVVTVPGPTDIGDAACQAYFLFCESEQIEPKAPYWPKWKAYNDFDPLDRVAPWRRVEWPALRLAVAGFNATMADTHEERRVEFGREQLDELSAPAPDGHALIALSAARPADATPFDHVVTAKGTGFEFLRLSAGKLETWSHRPGTATRHRTRDRVPARRDIERPTGDPAIAALIAPVEDAVRNREPDAVITRHVGDPAHLHVLRMHDFGAGPRPVGAYLLGVAAEVDAESLRRYREVFDRFHGLDGEPPGRIVYFGARPAPEIAELARRLRIGLVSIKLLRFSWDPAEFLEWQSRFFAADHRYPPELYIPQRYREVSAHGTFIDEFGKATATPSDNLDRRILDWLDDDAPRLIVVLGGAGVGKTFLLRTLARHLSEGSGGITPVYLELRHLERIRSLNEVVAANFARAQEHTITVPQFNYYLEHGDIVLLLDGLDELTSQNTYEQALEHLYEIRDKVRGQAKLVITVRDTEFLSKAEVLRVLGGNQAALDGRRALNVEDFGLDQIENFLIRRLEDPAAARERLELLRSLGELPGVARNPRMLSFIAHIDAERLRKAKEDSGGALKGAELYRQVLEQWMQREEERLKRPGQPPALTRTQVWDAMKTLALNLWGAGTDRVAVSELGHKAGLVSLVPDDARVHQIGSGSVLVQHEDGELGFIHRSIQEWLVAKAILDHPRPAEALAEYRLSGQAAQFYTELGGDLTAVLGMASSTSNRRLLEAATGDVILDYSQRDLRGTELPRDLSRRDFTGSDLSGLNLNGRDLQGASLVDGRLVGARLLGADLSGADLNRARLDRAALLGARVKPAQLDSATSTYGAALPGTPVEIQFEPTLAGHVAAIDPTGTLLATGDHNGWIQIYDCADGTPIRCWRALPGEVHSMAWARQDALLIGGGGLVGAWDPLTGRSIWRNLLAKHGRVTLAAAWDGDIAVLVDGDLYSGTNGVFDLQGHESATAIAWNATGETLAMATPGQIRLNKAADTDGATIAHETSATVMAWSPHDRMLAWGTSEGEVVVWGSEHVFTVEGEVRAICWSPDGRSLFCAAGSEVTEFPLDPPYAPRSYIVASEGIRWIGCTPGTGNLIIVSSNSVAAINPRAQQALWARAGMTNPVTRLDWRPDGSAILARDATNTLTSWDLTTLRAYPPEPAERLAHPAPLGSAVTWAMSHSLDDSMATGGGDGRITISRDGEDDRSWDALCGGITALAHSPDGERLASGGEDGLIRVWHPRTGDLLTTLIPLADNGSAAVDHERDAFVLHGELRGEFWYTAGLTRIDPVDLADYTEEVRRLE